MRAILVAMIFVFLFGCGSSEERRMERKRKEAQLIELKYQYQQLKEECKKRDSFSAGLIQFYAGALLDSPGLSARGAGNMAGGAMSYSECSKKKGNLRKKIKRLESEL